MTNKTRLALECGILTGAAIFAFLEMPLPVYKTEPVSEKIEIAISTDKIFESHGIRKVYPHSLIPGGIDGRDDFQHKVQRDPLVREFFRGFDVAHARTCILPKGRFFVTVREAETISWSTRPIEKGEQGCLTDGTRTVLLKCGNEVSFTPQDPSQEISTEEIEGPVWLPIPTGTSPSEEHTVGSNPVLIPPTNGSPDVPMPSILGIPQPPIMIVDLPQPPTMKVPEPSTGMLTSVGIIMFMLVMTILNKMRPRT